MYIKRQFLSAGLQPAAALGSAFFRVVTSQIMSIAEHFWTFRRLLQIVAESCRVLQNIAKYCRILQNLSSIEVSADFFFIVDLKFNKKVNIDLFKVKHIKKKTLDPFFLFLTYKSIRKSTLTIQLSFFRLSI